MIGQRFSHFEVTAKLGAGGMGEVYRAHDSKLGRDVAVKVLPEALGGDPDRLARLEREGRLLAQLDHPNIATLYGVEELGGRQLLMMQLVEGESLAQRLERGPLPEDEAVEIAQQIASALESAHEQGIVHRDLKPGNVMLDASGQARVLDFGLATETVSAGTESLENSPTLTMAATQAGVILGTASYMSPEQARGRALDKRTDIWSFGVVLYEMLTGALPFAGTDVTEILAGVITAEPDLERLSARTSPAVVDLVERCLRKDPRMRLRDMGDARIRLQEAQQAPDPGLSAAPARSSTVAWRWLAAGALAGAGLVVGWLAFSADEPGGARPLVVPTTSEPVALAYGDVTSNLSLSPDGSELVYVSEPETATDLPVQGGSRLLRRSREQLEPTPIPGTEGARYPVFSPDGEWLAFWRDGALVKVPRDGGSAFTLSEDYPSWAFGAAWSEDGFLYFTRTGHLMRVPEEGGEQEVLFLEPDMARGRWYPTSETVDLGRSARPRLGPPPGSAPIESEVRAWWPSALPGGKILLFSAGPFRAAWEYDEGALYALSPSDGALARIAEGVGEARYVAPGHLLAVTAPGEISAARFDVRDLRVRGEWRPVLTGAASYSVYEGGVHAALSAEGTLAWLPVPGLAQRRLVTVDRNGRQKELPPPPGSPTGWPRFSPAGDRLAAQVWSQESSGSLRRGAWVLDLERETWSLLGENHFTGPIVWSPDGEKIAFSKGPVDSGVWIVDAHGSSAPRLVYSEFLVDVTSWSSNDLLAFTSISGSWIYDLAADEVRPYLGTGSRRRTARVSPDAAWAVYPSDRSGEYEVYVNTFPQPTAETQVSTRGGSQPLWSPDGRAIYYAEGEQRLMRVTVDLSSGRPRLGLPEVAYESPEPFRRFDLSPDGETFLLLLDAEAPEVRQINMRFGLRAELEELLGGG